MKRTIVRLSLVIFTFCIVSLHIFAQKSRVPGSVVTLANETIKGFITQQNDFNYMRECIFFREGKMERYAPGEIHSYTIDGERIYESKFITMGTDTDFPIFAQCLVKGEVSMYLFIDKDRKKHYYLQKGEEFREINLNFSGTESATAQNRYKGQLKIFFGDCEELSEAIESAKARNSDILDLAIRYNECNGQKSNFIQTITQNFRKGLIFQYKFTNDFPVEIQEEIFKLGIDNINYTSVNPALEFEIGWFFEFYLGPKRNLSVIPSFVFAYDKVEVAYEQFPPEYYESPDGSNSAGCTSIKIPISIRYTINKFRVKPFFDAGMYFSFFTKGDGYLITEKESPLFIPPDTNTNSMYRIWLYNYHTWGVDVGAGLQIPVTDKISFDLGAKYWFSMPLSADETNSDMYQSFGIYLGFGF